MARYPAAKWRPLDRNYTATKTVKDCAILHSTASAGATSMYAWFSNPNAASSSHFHVADDGTVEQYVDTAHMSWANSAANPRSVTIETQGDGTKPWTPKQRAAIVDLLKWICDTHDIPARQMASSAKSEKGIGWHRLGCDGNFPSLPSILAGRTQRGTGESWSSARGKVCPGSDRIEQMPGIIAELKGDVKPAGAIKPRPPAAKPAGKTVAQMAAEVIAGKHGSGHDARRKSLGVSAAVYEQVRAEVNRRAGGKSPVHAGKSISQMATEVIAGKHGTGHTARQKSLRVTDATYAKVRAEVNKRA